VGALLPTAQSFQRLALLGSQEELMPRLVRPAASLGQFASELTAAFVQQAGIKTQLFQLAGARAGVQLRAMGLLGGVNFRL
jgi:hypothetical protein